MSGSLDPRWAACTGRLLLAPMRASFVCRQCRGIQVSAAPTTTPTGLRDAFGQSQSGPSQAGGEVSDAQFEVFGSTSSLLSVRLSPSQQLYTRRGTLVALAGKPENALSTLTSLHPLSRTLLGIPFLYQRITSTTPITALIGTKSSNTSFRVLNIDGTTDWMVSQRQALLAWTGHSLMATPRLQTGLAITHWGNTLLRGRGLAAVAAPGQTYEVTLGAGENMMAHPSHVVAYTVGRSMPTPVKLGGRSLRLTVPGSGWLSNHEWVRQMQASAVYQWLASAVYTVKTYARTWLFGGDLYLKFSGPATLLLSSRGVRIADVLTRDQVNEVADSQSGLMQSVVRRAIDSSSRDVALKDVEIRVAQATTRSKAILAEGSALNEFVR